MKQIKLDRADDRVKKFFRELPIEPDGVELELNGKVVCKVVGPNQMTAAGREAIVNRGRELMHQAHERNRGVPAKVIEREVREAVEDVRRRKKIMTSAILNTNVPVQSLISQSRAASSQVLDAYFDRRFELVYSQTVLDELLNVLLLPKIRKRHGLSDDEVLDFIASLLPYGRLYGGTWQVSPQLARDITDTKFLALAEESRADYLVTNDRRHLLPLRRFHSTRIVTPAQFLRELF